MSCNLESAIKKLLLAKAEEIRKGLVAIFPEVTVAITVKVEDGDVTVTCPEVQ